MPYVERDSDGKVTEQYRWPQHEGQEYTPGIVEPIRSYAELRAREYPMVIEQLDMIYNKGLDYWKGEIKKIKDKYPKHL